MRRVGQQDMDEERAVLFLPSDCELILDGSARMAHCPYHSCAVDGEAILAFLFPLGIERIGLHVAVRQEKEGFGNPKGVLLDEEMHACRIDADDRLFGRVVHILVRVEASARLGGEVEELLLVGVLFGRQGFLRALLPLLALLLPVLYALLLFLTDFSPRRLRHFFHHFCMRTQDAQRVVGLEESDFEAYGVFAMRECRVGNPIGDGVVMERRVNDEALLVEVQAAKDGQRVGRSREEERHGIGIETLHLEQMLCLSCFEEDIEHEVVGIVVDVGCDADGVVVGRVAPNGVIAHVPLAGSGEGVLLEGDALALLREEEVAVLVFEGKSTVASRLDALDAEASGAVRTRDAAEGTLVEDGVVEERVDGEEADQHSLDGFQVGCIEHSARDFHGVYLAASAEAVGVVAHRVALVVVHDSVAEVDGVGGVSLQRVVERNLHVFAFGAYIGGFQLRGRDDDFVVSVLELDKFVEANPHLACRDVHGAVGRIAGQHLRRYLVVDAAIGSADACASHQKEQCQACKYMFCLH